MPIKVVPELSVNPAAVIGEGDLSLCKVELENGSVALLIFQAGTTTPESFNLEERKADLAVVFHSVAAVDQLAAALAEARSLLQRLGRVKGVAESSGRVGPYLSLGRLREGLQGLLAEASFDPKLGDVIQASELRAFLGKLGREIGTPGQE
jgi:hypothetical protein